MSHLEQDKQNREEQLRHARDLYLSWMAESNIESMIAKYHRNHFGLGAFFFYFGASFLAHVVFNIFFG